MDKNNDLVKYISSEQAKGVSVEAIKNSLRSIGWKDEQFSSYFMEQVATPKPANIKPTINPESIKPLAQPIIEQKPPVEEVPVQFTIEKPVQVQAQPIQQTFVKPDFVEPTVLKTEYHWGKKIFFVVLILLLIAGGTSAFYYKDGLKKSLMDLPVIKDIFYTTDPVFQSEAGTPQTSQSLILEGTIKVLSPAVGETYSTGQTIMIKWTPGAPGMTEIDFLKSDNSHSVIVKPQNNPDTSGSMQYTFPVDMPLGQYKISLFYVSTVNGDQGAVSLFDSGKGYFNIVAASTGKVTPVVQNGTTHPIVTNTSFIDCGEANYDPKANDLENNLNSMSMKSLNAFKCFSTIIESCKDGTFSMSTKDKDSVSVSSKGNLCYLDFKVAQNKKTYNCSYPKTLPGVFFKSIYSDPKNASSELEKEISKGVSFEMALMIGAAMNTPKTGTSPEGTVTDFYGSKVTCKEI